MSLTILRAGPLTTLQDEGRHGARVHGVSASGPMDRGGYRTAAAGLSTAGATAIEFTRAGLSLRNDGEKVACGFAGGEFSALLNAEPVAWPGAVTLESGDVLDVQPGGSGNYGYLRFSREIDVPHILGSRSTNTVVRLGGLEGRALLAGDQLPLGAVGEPVVSTGPREPDSGAIRFVWGLHAHFFTPEVRARFVETSFEVSTGLNRMGVRLNDPKVVFSVPPNLSLVSDAVVPGDIQILGDGTPIVLMRDHQPTGGYPRIGTVIGADLDRFAQMRPGTVLAFRPVTLHKAQQLLAEAK